MDNPKVSCLSDLIFTEHLSFYDEHLTERASMSGYSSYVPCEFNIATNEYLISTDYSLEDPQYAKYYEITGDNPVSLSYYIYSGYSRVSQHSVFGTYILPSIEIKRIMESNHEHTFKMHGVIYRVPITIKNKILVTLTMKKIRNKWFVVNSSLAISKEAGDAAFDAFRKSLMQRHIKNY